MMYELPGIVSIHHPALITIVSNINYCIGITRERLEVSTVSSNSGSAAKNEVASVVLLGSYYDTSNTSNAEEILQEEGDCNISIQFSSSVIRRILFTESTSILNIPIENITVWALMVKGKGRVHSTRYKLVDTGCRL